MTLMLSAGRTRKARKNAKGVKKRPPSRRDKHAPLGAKTTPPPSRRADPAYPRRGKVAEHREAG